MFLHATFCKYSNHLISFAGPHMSGSPALKAPPTPAENVIGSAHAGRFQEPQKRARGGSGTWRMGGEGLLVLGLVEQDVYFTLSTPRGTSPKSEAVPLFSFLPLPTHSSGGRLSPFCPLLAQDARQGIQMAATPSACPFPRWPPPCSISSALCPS